MIRTYTFSAFVALFVILTAGCSFSLPRNVSTDTASDAVVTQSGAITDDTVAPETSPTTIESLEVPAKHMTSLPVSLTLSGTIIVGDVSAPRLRIVTDPACPYCQEFVLGDQEWLEQTYVANRRLALEIIFSPTLKEGERLSTALLCSQEQGKFSEVLQNISAHSMTTDSEILVEAKALSLNTKTMTSCMSSKRIASRLAAHRSIALSMQSQRVPMFSIGDQEWIGIEPRLTLQGVIERAL